MANTTLYDPIQPNICDDCKWCVKRPIQPNTLWQHFTTALSRGLFIDLKEEYVCFKDVEVKKVITDYVSGKSHLKWDESQVILCSDNNPNGQCDAYKETETGCGKLRWVYYLNKA